MTHKERVHAMAVERFERWCNHKFNRWCSVMLRHYSLIANRTAPNIGRHGTRA